MLLYFYCRFYVCLRSTLGMAVPILVGICAPFAFIGLGLLMFYVLHRKKDTSKGKTSFLIAIIIWENLTKNNLQWYSDQKVSFNIKTLFEIRIFRDFCKIARYKYKFVLFVCLFLAAPQYELNIRSPIREGTIFNDYSIYTDMLFILFFQFL